MRETEIFEVCNDRLTDVIMSKVLIAKIMPLVLHFMLSFYFNSFHLKTNPLVDLFISKYLLFFSHSTNQKFIYICICIYIYILFK